MYNLHFDRCYSLNIDFNVLVLQSLVTWCSH